MDQPPPWVSQPYATSRARVTCSIGYPLYIVLAYGCRLVLVNSLAIRWIRIHSGNRRGRLQLVRTSRPRDGDCDVCAAGWARRRLCRYPGSPNGWVAGLPGNPSCRNPHQSQQARTATSTSFGTLFWTDVLRISQLYTTSLTPRDARRRVPVHIGC